LSPSSIRRRRTVIVCFVFSSKGPILAPLHDAGAPEDTGIGIEPQDLQRIFSAFESGASPGSGGLGLGLAITRSLVEMHGGRIDVASEGRDKGCRFRVELPFAREAEQPAPDSGATGSPSPANGAGRRILLVDDHEDTALSLAVLLRRRGFQVRTAGTLREGLESAEEGLGILISDLALPDGSGHDLLARLRDRIGPVSAIAVSGFGSESDIERSRHAGYAEHVVKPVDIDGLVDILDRLVPRPAKSAPSHRRRETGTTSGE
jgi:CheY-like chemotaxis protein